MYRSSENDHGLRFGVNCTLNLPKITPSLLILVQLRMSYSYGTTHNCMASVVTYHHRKPCKVTVILFYCPIMCQGNLLLYSAKFSRDKIFADRPFANFHVCSTAPTTLELRISQHNVHILVHNPTAGDVIVGI